MNKRRVLKATPKHPNEEQEHVTHVPIEDVQVKGTSHEDSKTDEADVREFTSNSDAYDSWEHEDYLK